MKRSDIAGLMEKLSYKQTEANKAFSILRKMFNLAEVWGYRPDAMSLTVHKTAVMFMRYVHTEDKPVREGALRRTELPRRAGELA